MKFLRFIGRVLTMPAPVRDAWAEAQRRDKAEGERLDKEDPNWRANTFDGPGSHVSLFARFGDVLTERGLTDELCEHMRE